MTAITVSTEVNRSADDVFAYATDPTRFHEWQTSVTSGRMSKPGDPDVGTQCLTTRHIGFADRVITSEITHIDPPTSWGIHGIDGPLRADVAVTVEPITSDRSRLTIVLDFEGHGIGKILVPLAVRPRARKEMPRNLVTLKRLLEHRE